MSSRHAQKHSWEQRKNRREKVFKEEPDTIWHRVDQETAICGSIFSKLAKCLPVRNMGYIMYSQVLFVHSCTVTALQYYSDFLCGLIKGSKTLCAYHSITMVPFLSSLPRRTKPTMFSALSGTFSQDQLPLAECFLSWP